MLHKHHWQQFAGYGTNAWRCTTARSKAQLTHLCEDGCESPNHYEELGCLATLVRWHWRGIYFFCAPGREVIEVKKKPITMVIDEEYLQNAGELNDALKTLLI